jgi:hypothetical protein
MAIHTSAITYRRGIPNNYNNFYYVAQSNNVIPNPLFLYLRNYQFYNRVIINNTRYRWPWNN